MSIFNRFAKKGPKVYKGKPNYEVHLCKGCIKDLEEHYPYLMAREQLTVVEVPYFGCDNTYLGRYTTEQYNKRMAKRNPEWTDVFGFELESRKEKK